MANDSSLIVTEAEGDEQQHVELPGATGCAIQSAPPRHLAY